MAYMLSYERTKSRMSHIKTNLLKRNIANADATYISKNVKKVFILSFLESI